MSLCGSASRPCAETLGTALPACPLLRRCLQAQPLAGRGCPTKAQWVRRHSLLRPAAALKSGERCPLHARRASLRQGEVSLRSSKLRSKVTLPSERWSREAGPTKNDFKKLWSPPALTCGGARVIGRGADQRETPRWTQQCGCAEPLAATVQVPDAVRLGGSGSPDTSRDHWPWSGRPAADQGKVRPVSKQTCAVDTEPRIPRVALCPGATAVGGAVVLWLEAPSSPRQR